MLQVKNGERIYRWSIHGNVGALDSVNIGLNGEGVFWPFASGQVGIPVGAKDTINFVIRSLDFSDIGDLRILTYSNQGMDIFSKPRINFKIAMGLGITYFEDYAPPITWGFAYVDTKWELFRHNGKVLDSSVFARYQELKPTQGP